MIAGCFSGKSVPHRAASKGLGMKIEIECGACRRRFAVDDKFLGKKARCICGEAVPVVAAAPLTQAPYPNPPSPADPFSGVLDPAANQGWGQPTGYGFPGMPSGTPQNPAWGQQPPGFAPPAGFGPAGGFSQPSFGNPYASPPAKPRKKTKKQPSERRGPGPFDGSLPGALVSALFPVFVATSHPGADAIALAAVLFIFLGSVFVPMSIIFHRAGQNPWLSIVPIANLLILLDITGNETWLILLAFVPIANLFVAWSINIRLAEMFGRGPGFALGLFFLPFIFYPILVFTPN